MSSGDVGAKRTTSLWTVYGEPLLLIAAAVSTAMAISGWRGTGATDFLTFRQSAGQLLAHVDPYVPFAIERGPNLNPPWVVAAMAPFAWLSVPAGLLVWRAISLACLFASAALIARTIAPVRALPIACAVLVTQAAFSNLALGQVAWPLMLLVTAAWRADRRRRCFACGALLGVAASWKPFLLVFVPYLAWRREWRSLAVFAIAIAATVLVGLVVVGASGYRSWTAVVRTVYWEELLLNASVRGFFARVLIPPSLASVHTTPIVLAPAWRTPLWLSASGGLTAITAWRIAGSRSVDRAWASLAVLALLVSPLGWVHYVPIATGPIVAALVPAQSRVRWIAAIGWVLLCVPFLWLRDLIFGPLLTLTLASSYMWGTLLLLVATLLARQIPADAGGWDRMSTGQ